MTCICGLYMKCLYLLVGLVDIKRIAWDKIIFEYLFCVLSPVLYCVYYDLANYIFSCMEFIYMTLKHKTRFQKKLCKDTRVSVLFVKREKQVQDLHTRPCIMLDLWFFIRHPTTTTVVHLLKKSSGNQELQHVTPV